MKFSFQALLGVLLPKWVREWKEYPSRLRTHLGRLRFERYDWIPSNPRNTHAYPEAPLHFRVTTAGRTQNDSMGGGGEPVAAFAVGRRGRRIP